MTDELDIVTNIVVDIKITIILANSSYLQHNTDALKFECFSKKGKQKIDKIARKGKTIKLNIMASIYIKEFQKKYFSNLHGILNKLYI